MVEKTINYNIEKLKIHLKKQRKIFKQQLKEVEMKYPLVAFTFHLQEAAIMQMPLSKKFQATQVGPLIKSITNIEVGWIKETEMKRKKCWSNFHRDLIEAGYDGGEFAGCRSKPFKLST